MPLTPAEEQELAQLQQSDASKGLKSFLNPALNAQMTDRIKMGANPNLQGPRMSLDPTPEEAEQGKEALNAAAGSFVPEGSINPVSWLINKSPLGKIPDKMMQAAVGMKKYVPGVGDTLINEGVWGTKSGMQEQIASKLQKEVANREAVLGSMSGRIDSGQISSKVAQMSNKFSVDGVVPEAVRPQVGVIQKAAADIGSRGQVSPRQAGKFAQISGEIGYQGDKPVERLAGQVARTENSGYRQALSDQYANEFGDSVPNKVDETYGKLAAFIKGKQGLSKAQPLNIVQPGVKDLALGGIGAVLGGAPGSAIGYAASKAAQTPLARSIGAQALGKGGSAVSKAMPYAAGRVAEEKANNQPQSGGLTPEEEHELQTLLSSQ